MKKKDITQLADDVAKMQQGMVLLLSKRSADCEQDLVQILAGCPPFPYTVLVAQEWEVVPGMANYGVGDLVFSIPSSAEYLVIETKYLNKRSGRTAKTLRNRGRHKVKEQAEFYGRKWSDRHPRAKVVYAYFTNEVGLVPLGEFYQHGGKRWHGRYVEE